MTVRYSASCHWSATPTNSAHVHYSIPLTYRIDMLTVYCISANCMVLLYSSMVTYTEPVIEQQLPLANWQ
jgi:hypothetical protein